MKYKNKNKNGLREKGMLNFYFRLHAFNTYISLFFELLLHICKDINWNPIIKTF